MIIALSTVVVMSNLLSLEQRRQKVTEPVIDPWGTWFSAIVKAATDSTLAKWVHALPH